MPTLRRLIAIACTSAACSAWAAPTILNGSLTGPIANGATPPSWTLINGSPDTMDQNNNVGVAGDNTSFAAGPTVSNDGGTWVGLGREGAFVETIGQLVNGFVAGTLYTIFWEHANFGYSPAGYTGANEIEVLIDGMSIGSGASLGLDRLWHDESVSFIATAASHQVNFRLGADTKAYHSIDGIGIRGGNQVPEPLSLALVGLGLAGIAATRRTARKV